jgi:hypothetical protein
MAFSAAISSFRRTIQNTWKPCFGLIARGSLNFWTGFTTGKNLEEGGDEAVNQPENLTSRGSRNMLDEISLLHRSEKRNGKAGRFAYTGEQSGSGVAAQFHNRKNQPAPLLLHGMRLD